MATLAETCAHIFVNLTDLSSSLRLLSSVNKHKKFKLQNLSKAKCLHRPSKENQEVLQLRRTENP